MDDALEVVAGARPWAVVEGDCLDVLRRLPDGCADAVVTDPPYGVDYQSAWRTGNRRMPKIANDRRPFVWWLAEAARSLKPDGCLLCFCRWDVAEAFRLAIGWAGLKVGAQLVWDRVGHGLGDPSSRPAPRHDLVWFAAGPGYQLPGRRPTSVYAVPRLAGNVLEHPNEKPVVLMEALVMDYTPEGGLVIDPFAGSGTTGVACRNLGRRFLGVELNAEYAAVARRRLGEANPLADAIDTAAHARHAQGELFGDNA